MFTIAYSAEKDRLLSKSLRVDGERVTDEYRPPNRYRFSRCYDGFGSAQSIAHFLRRVTVHQRQGEFRDWEGPLPTRRDVALILSTRKDDAPSGGERQSKDFERAAADFYVCEMDGAPFLPGYSRDDLLRDPAGTLDAHIRKYHGLTERTAYVAMLSSSAGFSKKGEPVGLRYHLWLALDRLYQPREIDYIDEQHVARFGKIFDTSIRQPGHLLAVAPPLFENCADPFPERIFYSHGEVQQVAFPFPPEFERFEQAELMPMRGRSSATPLLNGDAFASESFRTEAVHQWIAAMRWRDPKMTWGDARPLLQAELQRVNASNDARKRLGGPSLKEAQRMWNAFRFESKEQRSTFALPRFVEPRGSAQQAYDELEQVFTRQLETPGFYLNKVSLGTGKTQQIADKATRDRRGVVVLGPSIERCHELAERLNAADERRREEEPVEWEDYDPADERGKPWTVWLGRQQPGMCERAELAESYQSLGKSVHSDLCGHGEEKKCPHFATCPHAAQYDYMHRVRWVLPSQSLTHERRIGNEAEVVLIDEGVVDSLIGSTSFPLSRLLEPREPRLNALSLKVHTALAHGDTERMSARDFGLTRDEIEEALALELSLKPDVIVSPDMADEAIRKRIEDAQGCWHPPLFAFWRCLLAEYDLARDHVNAIHKYFARDVAEWRVKVGWRVQPRFLREGQSVVLFDATPNETALLAHFPTLETFEFQARNENVHVAQVLDVAGRRNQFIGEKSEKDEERARNARERLAQWLRAQPGYTVAIVKKEVRRLLEEEHAFERVSFGHFGAVQGQDVWQFPDGTVLKGAEIDNLALFGRMTPPAWEPENIAMAHHWDGPKIKRQEVPQDGGIPWYDQVPRAVADGYAGVVLRHPDERVDAVLRNIYHSALLQAFGRGRATRRDKPLRVFLGQNVAIEVEVHEALTQSQLSARVGDVLLLSPKEVERLIGYCGDFARRIRKEPNVRYWVREGQTQPFSAWVRPGADVDASMRSIGALRWEADKSLMIKADAA
jgi:hypothetical protein